LWAALGETERTDEQGRSLARLNATLNDAFRAQFADLIDQLCITGNGIGVVQGWRDERRTRRFTPTITSVERHRASVPC
jgi:hypothetical protein